MITCWQSLLVMLDKSIQGEAFFKAAAEGAARVTRAAQRNRVLRAGDRFEVQEEGRYEVEDYLSYEEFEARGFHMPFS